MICFKTNVGNIVEEFAMWAITACSYRHRSRISRVEPQLSMGNRVLGHPIEISMCKHDGIIGAHHLGCRRFRNTRVTLNSYVYKHRSTSDLLTPETRLFRRFVLPPHTRFSQSFPFTYPYRFISLQVTRTCTPCAVLTFRPELPWILPRGRGLNIHKKLRQNVGSQVRFRHSESKLIRRTPVKMSMYILLSSGMPRTLACAYPTSTSRRPFHRQTEKCL